MNFPAKDLSRQVLFFFLFLIVLFSAYFFRIDGFSVSSFAVRDMQRAQQEFGLLGPETLAGWRIPIPSLYYVFLRIPGGFYSLVILHILFFSTAMSALALVLFRRHGFLTGLFFLIFLLSAYPARIHLFTIWNPSFLPALLAIFFTIFIGYSEKFSWKKIISLFFIICIGAGFHLQFLVLMPALVWPFLNASRKRRLFTIICVLIAISLPLITRALFPINQMRYYPSEVAVAAFDLLFIAILLIDRFRVANAALPLVSLALIPAAFYYFHAYHIRYLILQHFVLMFAAAPALARIYSNLSSWPKRLVLALPIVAWLFAFVYFLPAEKSLRKIHALSNAFARMSITDWSERTYIVGDRTRASWVGHNYFYSGLPSISLPRKIASESYIVVSSHILKYFQNDILQIPFLNSWLKQILHERRISLANIYVDQDWTIYSLKNQKNWPLTFSNIAQDFFKRTKPESQNVSCIFDPYDGACLIELWRQIDGEKIVFGIEANALSSSSRFFSFKSAKLSGISLAVECGNKKLRKDLTLPKRIGNIQSTYAPRSIGRAQIDFYTPFIYSYANPCGTENVTLFFQAKKLERVDNLQNGRYQLVKNINVLF